MTYITSIGLATPPFRYHQDELITYMQEQTQDPTQKKKTSVLFTKSQIQYRHSVLPDFGLQPQQNLLFNVEEPGEPLVEKRMEVFKNTAVDLVVSAIQDCMATEEENTITDLITVTCTGMMAPGLDIKLMEKLNLMSTVNRYSVNFMGCHAGFQALRMAENICKNNPDAKVLIADVELCTLHFRKPNTDDQIVANSLFADGAAAVIVSGKPGDNPCLKLKETANRVILNGQNDMAWDICSDGFLMSLSSYVPDLLGADLKNSFEGLFQSEIEKETLNWAIHPGGPKILQKFAENVEIPFDKLNSSLEVLQNYGNMSSCTIFFILKNNWEALINDRKPIVAAGFGPGLTMEAALFSVYE